MAAVPCSHLFGQAPGASYVNLRTVAVHT